MTRLFTAEEIERKSAANRAAHQPRMVNLLDVGKQYAKAGRPKVAAPKKNKYSAVKMEVDGIKFDSRKEARRYADLKLLEAAGEIRNLERQVAFHIEVNGFLICKYIADFVYVRNGIRVVSDVKGYRTAIYLLKRKLMHAVHGIEIEES